MRIDLRSGIALVIALVFCTSLSIAQFRPALPGYRFEFPRDYFDHPDYQTEWWYYTGNLESADRHKFGFELTFFRQGVSRGPSATSAWELKDIYLAHFALSDLSGKAFFHTERINRAGPGIAGASAVLQKVWNGNWIVSWAKGAEQLGALYGDYSLNLSLQPQKPPVIHGENGVSQKSPGAGHASHYFSETRLAASGVLTFATRRYSVSGLAWMDHEFFSHQLSTDQVGWDWLSLQLSDNTELMLFRIRKRDGSIDAFSSGTLVDAQGHSKNIHSSEFQLSAGPEHWVSPSTGARYPTRWELRIPSLNLTLEAITPLQSQELVATSEAVPSYWEGAILLQGKKNSAAISGSGYLEMTGYARPFSDSLCCPSPAKVTPAFVPE